MKNIFLFILLSISISCTAQTYPLRTFTDIPENAYLKDLNNELNYYAGTWKGIWNNKTIYIIFKKNTYIYDNVLKYYKDNLIGKFKVLDSNGNILFDNFNSADNNAKIWGGKFRKADDKYSLTYNDPDLCNTSGNIIINFTDSTRTKLNWKLNKGSNIITTDCQYYNTTPFPQALPEEMILTKQ
ncbi:hypothetical protein BBI01_04470 [Chryseobacterium artocarpi]|uniref:DUF6705 domain-containing protein n=1 Tax=Chryseobacterium artocarpi TaxID=1414727 RepID=A0A1B8ZWI6_9FLAO|nr:DUF6705 family protein [Chryseobacterium artocarpi]OCA75958.1 hypothetical protein BBI01_04470 [Chryseobacterium artocarpi]